MQQLRVSCSAPEDNEGLPAFEFSASGKAARGAGCVTVGQGVRIHCGNDRGPPALHLACVERPHHRWVSPPSYIAVEGALLRMRCSPAAQRSSL